MRRSAKGQRGRAMVAGVLGWGLLGGIGGYASPVRGEGASSRVAPSGEHAYGVGSNAVLSIAADVPAWELLRDAIREILARRGVRVVDAGSEESGSALVRVDVSAAPGDATRVVVTRGRDGSTLVQRTVAHERNPSISREEIAETVRTAVEAELLDRESSNESAATSSGGTSSSGGSAGKAVGATEAHPTNAPNPPAARATAPPEASREAAGPSGSSEDVGTERSSSSSTSPLAFDIETFVAAGPFSSRSGAVVRPGFALSLVSRKVPRLGVGVLAQYALPFDIATADLAVHTQVLSLRTLVGIEAWRRDRVTLSFGIGGGVDRLSVAPRSDTLPGSILEAKSTRLDPVATGAASMRVRLGAGAVFLIRAMVDADFSERRYVIDDHGTPVDVFVPWRVRPTLAIGFGFTAFGDPAFAQETRGAR